MVAYGFAQKNGGHILLNYVKFTLFIHVSIFSEHSEGRSPGLAHGRPSPAAVHKRIEEGIGFLFKRFEDVLQKYARIWNDPNDQ